MADAFEQLRKEFESEERPLPVNTGRELKRRLLDCLVVNRLAGMERFRTIRCPSEEGNEAFEGSMIRQKTHIQIAVRDPAAAILGVFRSEV